MTRVIAASIAAGIDSWIQTLPHGYETLCGENGIHLSGGQRQRIGIARALYSAKPLLVMDEPTSALDITSEAEVIEAILNLDKQMTVIVITHRDSLIEKFDHIYSIQNNKVTRSW